MISYTVQEIDVSDKNLVSAFLRLPETIYRNIPQWVPPLNSDALRIFDTRKNPFYKHSTAAFFIAFDSNHHPVARLACINNQPYNKYNNEKTAFFYLFESQNLPDVSRTLFDKAIYWAGKQGLDKIIGPKGFSILDGMGLLAEGFEFRPALGISYNPAYYIDLIENVGFQMTDEIVSGYMKPGNFVDPKIALVAQRVKERKGLTIAQFRTRKDLNQLIPRFQELYNDAIKGTVGNYPLSPEDAKTMANQLLWFADPKMIKIVMKETRPVGFLFAYPDISEAFQKTKGRLFPFGWIKIMHSLATTTCLDINGAGMIEEYRGSGGTAILLDEITKSIQNSRYDHAEIVQINANNERMLLELSNFGITFNKKHRLYSLTI